MKTSLLVLFVCLFLAGCGARAGSGGLSSSMGKKEVEQRLDLVESYIKNDQPQRALQELLKVEDSADHLSRYHFDVGMIYLGLNELDKARDGFAQAAEIDDNFGEAWNNLGKVQEAMGKTQEAEAAYTKAISILTYITPEFPAYNLGSMYLKQDRAKDAETAARKALARNWRYLPAYKLLSDSLSAQNRIEEAETVLRHGMEADMGSTSMTLALAELQMRTGKQDQARELFERILTQNPKSNDAKVARDYLGILQ